MIDWYRICYKRWVIVENGMKKYRIMENELRNMKIGDELSNRNE